MTRIVPGVTQRNAGAALISRAIGLAGATAIALLSGMALPHALGVEEATIRTGLALCAGGTAFVLSERLNRGVIASAGIGRIEHIWQQPAEAVATLLVAAAVTVLALSMGTGMPTALSAHDDLGRGIVAVAAFAIGMTAMLEAATIALRQRRREHVPGVDGEVEPKALPAAG